MDVSLFSDTLTTPTAGMFDAMTRAVVGDEQRGTDPTVKTLEARVADLLGHEAGVFLPSGTMCNAIAVRLHIRPSGDEIILDEFSHVAASESGGAAALSGASLRLLRTCDGRFTGSELEQAIRPASRYSPTSRLVIAEQTVNLAGGRVWTTEQLDDVLAAARRHGLRTHLDGARLMNAVVASGTPAGRFAGHFDTALLDFSKGLGCPLGAVLVGSADMIQEAWRYKQMWGGAMRQTGYVAAACLYALDHNIDRLHKDHESAKLLAQWLADTPRIEVNPDEVETNIVVFAVDDPMRLADWLRPRGVDLLVVDRRRLRAVTYMGISEARVKEAVALIREGIQAITY